MSFSPFQFGQQIYSQRGFSGVSRVAQVAFQRSGPIDAGLFVAGALSPTVGTALGVASALYGAKQIYEGIFG